MKALALAAALASAYGASSAAKPAAGTAAAIPAAAAVTLSRGGSHADQAPGFRRFALVVGANDGGANRVRLRYAATDASAFSNVLTELGGVAREDLLLLQEPTRGGFLEAMDDLRRRIAGASAAGARAELLVYFSGHSDEAGLIFGKERVTYPEFRARIDAAPARIRLAVVDACASGALTRLKGGSRLPAFSVDQSSNLSGYAFLTSSSGAESAQESDRIRASFFTHYLVTGLRGGADRNQDGKVTLGEAYEFAFQETLSQTEGSQAGAQHPSYDMRLTGTGDLVLTDLRGTSAGLVLDPKLRGRVFVRAASGSLVAELQKQPGKRVELGLEPGIYDLSLDQGDSLYRALIKVDTLTHLPVTAADFSLTARERTRNRGGADTLAADSTAMRLAMGMDTAGGSGLRTPVPIPAPAPAPIPDAPWISARVSLTPSVGFPGDGAGPWSHNLSLSLLAGEAVDIEGAQISLGANSAARAVGGLQFAPFNFSSGESRGVQLGLIANGRARFHQGLQLAAVANTSDSVIGMQAALVNHSRRATGLQLGGLNAAGSQRGVQAGLINVSLVQTGVQAGLMNFADTSRGLQAGLINYATYGESAVLGLISIVGNGLHDVEATLDEKSMMRTALVLGGKYNYNYVSFDMKARDPRFLWGGSAGVGVHLPQKYVFADGDIGAGILWNDYDWDNISMHLRVRGIVGLQPMRWFSIFAGATYNAEAWPGSRFPNLNPNKDGEAWGDDLRAVRWPGFVLGVRI
jgi:hypothetical protein